MDTKIKVHQIENIQKTDRKDGIDIWLETVMIWMKF